jgi:hypothetical protein
MADPDGAYVAVMAVAPFGQAPAARVWAGLIGLVEYLFRSQVLMRKFKNEADESLREKISLERVAKVAKDAADRCDKPEGQSAERDHQIRAAMEDRAAPIERERRGSPPAKWLTRPRERFWAQPETRLNMLGLLVPQNRPLSHYCKSQAQWASSAASQWVFQHPNQLPFGIGSKDISDPPNIIGGELPVPFRSEDLVENTHDFSNFGRCRG